MTGAAQPRLSVILTGRNDGYGGDFRQRFFTTLAFNHQQLAARGVPHEFVFVEWAPSPGAPTLFDLVFDAVPGLDHGAVRWYLVDPLYQEYLSLNPSLRYLEYVAKNVGIRRATGAFVLATNCDILLSRAVLDVLERDALEAGRVYRAPRYDLKLASDRTGLDWDVLEDERNLDGPPRRLKPPYMPGGTGDFLLADRGTFHQLRGFNEVYRLARAGIDRNFVVKALSSGVPLADIGGPVYHMHHVGSYRSRSKTGGPDVASAGRAWHPNAVIYQNPENWGLRDAPARAVDERCWRLEFAEAALPRMVDLRAIELPVARPGGAHPARAQA